MICLFFSSLLLVIPFIASDRPAVKSPVVLPLHNLLASAHGPQPLARSSRNETGTFLKKFKIFSKLKWKSKDMPNDLTPSDSSPIVRFSPYSVSIPPVQFPFRPFHPMSPLASPSMRVMSYYPTPYFMNPDPLGVAARRVAMAPRPAYMPPSLPAYFPLGSMSGTPIIDPSIQAALASSLVNRYSAPLPLIGGPSYLPSSFYDDMSGIDQASLANVFKRYFKNNKKSKYPKYGDDSYHKSEYDMGYGSSKYDYPRIKYPSYRPLKNREDRLKNYDYTIDRPLDDYKHEPQYGNDDHKFDSRVDNIVTTPSLPRYRDRTPGYKQDTISEPFMDIYSWNPSRSETFDDMKNRNDTYRYPSESQSFGSGNTLLPPFDKEKERMIENGDIEKDRSF